MTATILRMLRANNENEFVCCLFYLISEHVYPQQLGRLNDHRYACLIEKKIALFQERTCSV